VITLSIVANIGGVIGAGETLSGIIQRLVGRCNGAIKIECAKRDTLNELTLGSHRTTKTLEEQPRLDVDLINDASPVVATPSLRFWEINGPFRPGKWYFEMDFESILTEFPLAVGTPTLDIGVSLQASAMKPGDQMITLRADRKLDETTLIIEDPQGPVDGFYLNTTMANINTVKVGKVGLPPDTLVDYRRKTNKARGVAGGYGAALDPNLLLMTFLGKKEIDITYTTGTTSTYAAMRYDGGKVTFTRYRKAGRRARREMEEGEVDPAGGGSL
jgi:hypothetical protein